MQTAELVSRDERKAEIKLTRRRKKLRLQYSKSFCGAFFKKRPLP
jgi:hypothetical protein